MRADKSLKRTASDILNEYSQEKLCNVFRSYGELHNSKRIARDIVSLRKTKKIKTTGDLVNMMKRITPRRYLNRDLSKLFQSLRIEVNNELENLRKALGDAVTVMSTGARLVVVSYHSLEDRIVKNFFRNSTELRIITRKPLTPSIQEISQNARARSAKLRAAEKL
jgi:16S rRNA (cytosine1402-N4)-methyltransferase